MIEFKYPIGVTLFFLGKYSNNVLGSDKIYEGKVVGRVFAEKEVIKPGKTDLVTEEFYKVKLSDQACAKTHLVKVENLSTTPEVLVSKLTVPFGETCTDHNFPCGGITTTIHMVDALDYLPKGFFEGFSDRNICR